MKIRTFLVDVANGTDPIRRLFRRVNPAPPDLGEGGWLSYHYPPGASHGVVFARYDEAVFDPATLAALDGVDMVPPARLDQRYTEVRSADRTALKQRIEARTGTWDDSRIADWEDALCEVMRRNGESGRRKLRSAASQRGRTFLDEFA